MMFTDRVSVITGAASGIGQALAVELAKRGSDLALCDVDEDGLAETVRRVEALGRKATSARVDVADRTAFYDFAERTLAQHGRVDAVVNNAGVSLTISVAEMSYEDLEWIVGINFWGVVHGTKAFLPHLRERRDGWIVNISSVFGIIAVPCQSAYNATKFAVRGFTEALRQEVQDEGITVCCVHPGGIRTNIVRRGRFLRDQDGRTDKEEMVENFDRIARTSPEGAALTIANGMERRRPKILIGTDAYIIETVQRIAPVRYPQIFKPLAVRLRRPPGD